MGKLNRFLLLIAAGLSLTVSCQQIGKVADSSSSSTSTAADTTAPSVSFTAPTGGAVMTNGIHFAGTASDDTGVTLVEISINNGSFVSASGTAGWSYDLPILSLQSTNISVTVRARDNAGNTGSNSIICMLAPSVYYGSNLVMTNLVFTKVETPIFISNTSF